MTQVELDDNAKEILERVKSRENYENLGDAVRHLDNLTAIQAAVIHKQDNEIEGFKVEIARLNVIMETAGVA